MKRVAVLATLALLIASAPAQVRAAQQQCSKEDVRALVASFVHAYNEGRSQPDGSFDFYSEVVRRSDERIARGYYPVKGNAYVAEDDDSCRLRLWNMVPLWYQRCDRFRAKFLVKEFVAAYNEGNMGALNHVLAGEPEFETYTDYRAVAGVVPFIAPRQARSVVPGFLESRHRMHEHIKLVDYQLGRKVRWGWGFGFTIRKTADDIVLPGGIEQTGKGAITNDCKIFVWKAGS